MNSDSCDVAGLVCVDSKSYPGSIVTQQELRYEDQVAHFSPPKMTNFKKAIDKCYEIHNLSTSHKVCYHKSIYIPIQ